MTNVDFFRAFAKDTTTVSTKPEEYYFEHSREDFANLYDALSPDDDQIKMFHYTTGIDPQVNDNGSVEGVAYRGEMLVLLTAPLDETIDGQLDSDYTDGKYEKRVKDLIEDGGVIAKIIEYNNCRTDRVELEVSDIKEVYNMFDFNADGIYFKYDLYIEA